MASITKQLSVVAKEAMAGEAEGATEATAAQQEAAAAVAHAAAAEQKEYTFKFHRFETMQEILFEFFDTNVAELPLSELLKLPSGVTRFLKFFHCSIPYLATVSMQWHHKLQLVIKLPNDGFFYIEKPGKYWARHNSDTWISLPSMQQYFSNLIQKLPDHTNGKFFYNYKEQRVDIFLKALSWTVPNILVTYEPGYPYRDDDDDEALVPLR
jgi:hypothetical protein